MASQKGRANTNTIPEVITVIAKARRPPSRLCIACSKGQVDTTIMLAQIDAAKKGRSTQSDPAIDTDLVSKIAKATGVPLVLHGSSGVSDADLQSAIRAGMRKINIATHLNHVFSDSVRAILASDPALVDPRKYIGAGRKEVASEITRLLKILNLE